MKTNRLITVALSILFTFILSHSFAQKNGKKEADKQNEKKFGNTQLEKDVDFVVTAADDGIFEVQVAALAKIKALSPKVKELAERVMTDHSKANEELKKIAAKKNITLPTKLSNKNQDQFDKLTKLEGKEFDDEFTKLMVAAQKDAISMFEKEADKGKDGELKAWAAGKIPVLKQHLQMAEAVKETMKQ